MHLPGREKHLPHPESLTHLLPPAIFGVLSLLILLPLLKPGYILTLDMVFGPNTGFSEVFYGLRPAHGQVWLLLIFEALSHIMPMWSVQKLFIFLILFLSGISAYHLCPGNTTGKLFAGLLYTLNPFVYVRFLAGHFLLLLGYATLPFAIKALINLFNMPTQKNTLKALLFTTLVGVFSVHMLVLLFLSLPLMLLLRIIQQRKSPRDIKKILLSTTGMLAGFTGLNSYWLIPLLSGAPTGVENIGTADIFAFATQPALTFNTLFTVAGMYGFWRGGYVYVKDLLPQWYLLFIFILFLCIHGAISYHRAQRCYPWVYFFTLTAMLAAILATGISGPFAGVFNFLFEHTGIFRGFREPQKFVALLALSYAYLGGLGVTNLSRTITHPLKNMRHTMMLLIVLSALATPIIYSYTMFNGFGNQLEPTDYPEDWYEIKTELSGDKTDFNILFLPWHLYMDFKWIPTPQKRIGNPAAPFFGSNTISGDNMEVGSIYTSSTSPRSAYIESLLARRDNISNLGALLAPLNVKYILLAKEVDYQTYSFLHHQEDLELLKDTPTLLLFKNKQWKGGIYGINSIKDTASQSTEPVNYQKISPIRYLLTTPETEYILFARDHPEQWRLDGEQGMQNPAGTTIFNNTHSNNSIIYYQRFNAYKAGYLLSLLTLLGIIYLYLRR